jgi:multicomponent Na+:H+ antiporter subunit D
MDHSVMILFAIFVPIAWGIFLLIKPEYKSRKTLVSTTAMGLAFTVAFSLVVLFSGDMSLQLFTIGKNMDVYFQVDAVSRIFASLVTLIWPLAGLYAFEYMSHYTENKRYFGFYMMVFGVLLALCFSGSILTFYIFYEMMTLFSMALVFQVRSKEAIMAGLKYLFYSLVGAYCVLFGMYFLNQYTDTLHFIAGGTVKMETENVGILLVAAFSMIIGFGVKAGMFPMHAWLPTAHPIAPAPASAVMSSLIVKMGVLGMFRVVYFIFGTEFLRGTWVQTTWLILTLLTVFMGSMLAYREKVFKKRLAYSTVSQLSYILFGFACMHPIALVGALLHVVFHAVIKSALFMSAGAVIHQTKKTRVDELRGIGKEMPITMWSFTLCACALIGFPPFSGFISKWYLATGALQTELGVFSWLGPVVLLISALLTAGYLLPISIDGFLPGADYDYKNLKKNEPKKIMVVPIVILAAIAVLLGVFPNPLTELVKAIAQAVM